MFDHKVLKKASATLPGFKANAYWAIIELGFKNKGIKSSR